jgi:hypothetical protein
MSEEAKKLPMELVSVVLVFLSMVFAAGFTVLWVACGIGDGQKSRLVEAVHEINLNWKMGLFLLIPLFYRTIREILERVGKGPLGTTFPLAKQPTGPTDGGEDGGETKEATPRTGRK